MNRLVIPRRFHGPPHSGNGGWTAGALARHLPGGGVGATITVRLRLPPPLETPLTVDDAVAGAGQRRALVDPDGRTVAEAILSEADLTPAPPVAMLAADDAEERYAGRDRHPFPGCFVCGPDRRADDGLRIFAGPATSSAGEQVVAATWTPYERDVATTWAALDCPGGWSSDIVDRPMVLGTMTARIERLPRTSDRYVVVGQQRRVEGRKTFTAATLYDDTGAAIATAEHVWISVDPATFG